GNQNKVNAQIPMAICAAKIILNTISIINNPSIKQLSIVCKITNRDESAKSHVFYRNGFYAASEWAFVKWVGLVAVLYESYLDSF
uniref:hypothetical protein n=1 Tax=Staphylococcus aureus TaxID=1280 RepID=UPI00301C1D51